MYTSTSASASFSKVTNFGTQGNLTPLLASGGVIVLSKSGAIQADTIRR
jgi:hypothetical protein